MEMSERRKNQTNPLEYQDKFSSIKYKYQGYRFLFTDGSKDGPRAAYAVTSRTLNFCSERLPDICSIFTAELMAIYKALQIACRSHYGKFVICSDSKSALQALESKLVYNPMVLDVLMAYAIIPEEKEVLFCWVPSHVDIEGNEKADFYAKQALNKEVTDFTVPYTDFRPLINEFILHCWQMRWQACEGNKLHFILPSVKHNLDLRVTSRRDQTVLHRCLIGHSRLTHLHLLFHDRPPVCDRCQYPLTIKHILIECDNLPVNRPYQVNSLQQLFHTTSPHLIIQFLRKIGIYHDI